MPSLTYRVYKGCVYRDILGYVGYLFGYLDHLRSSVLVTRVRSSVVKWVLKVDSCVWTS